VCVCLCLCVCVCVCVCLCVCVCVCVCLCVCVRAPVCVSCVSCVSVCVIYVLVSSGARLRFRMRQFDAIKAKGVDHILCVSVNDKFVMRAWAASQNAGAKVAMVADGAGVLTKVGRLVLHTCICA
jgi:hypothetical protein